MTYDELKQRQGWTLEQKIDHAVGVVSSFMERVNGKVAASYSGGKDYEKKMLEYADNKIFQHRFSFHKF
jgi:hypothetical protein